MSLYHEAASIVDTAQKSGGSLKSLVFGKKTWKTDAKTLFALTTEATKWSQVLSEVVERSGILKIEKQLSPTLVLVLAHDLLLSKKGIALPQKHGLNASISKHRARLSAELTKERLRRGCATIEELRASIDDPDADRLDVKEPGTVQPRSSPYPRWIRINAIRTSLAEQLDTTFKDYVQVDKISEVTARSASDTSPALHIDKHVPNLVAISPRINISTSKAYKEGQLILQDKASCFPAYLLDPGQDDGDVIDACAAPGNKTTHLAAIIHETRSPSGRTRKVIACEKDALRSQTLEKMTGIAGADQIIIIRASQDAMKQDPHASRHKHVTAILLDPSCSGSGIVGRDEGSITVRLPRVSAGDEAAPKGKKRKRSAAPKSLVNPADETAASNEVAVEETAMAPETDAAKLTARLTALSDFQLRLVKHAMAFPVARRIAYSTCSVHPEENEHVVVQALRSDVAVRRGWRIMAREEQVEGMRTWHTRGWADACRVADAGEQAPTIADGCIRCEKGTEDGTMGFFVAAFVRDGETDAAAARTAKDDEDEEWNGFA